MDKRRHRRVKASGVAGHLRSDTRTASCAVENLSAGGMFVRTAVAMPVGSPVLVDLVRPGLKKAIQVSGRVVNVVSAGGGHAPGLGIAFDRMPAEVEQRVADLLAQLDVGTPSARPRESEQLVPRTMTQEGLVTVRWKGPAGAVAEPAVEPSRGTPVPDNVLLANVKGLFEELSRAQAELQARDDEIANLKAEIQRLRAELRRR